MQKDFENITVRLEGEDALKFRRFKAKENLKLNSEAGRKIILDRLDRVFPKESKQESVDQ